MKILAMVLQVIGIFTVIIGIAMMVVVFYFSISNGRFFLSAFIGCLLSLSGMAALAHGCYDDVIDDEEDKEDEE